MATSATKPNRCGWVHDDPVEIAYHDQEWGVPLHDDRKLFEFLVLDGFQAGLSWLTILRKRAAFRQAFDGFDPAKVARYDSTKQQVLLQDHRIVRNRLKIKAASTNARAFLQIQADFGSFATYLWAFVDGCPIHNTWPSWEAVPATSPISDALSRDLKHRGFTFVGSTICYAFMQAAGLVNDHTVDCFRHHDIRALSSNPQSGQSSPAD